MGTVDGRACRVADLCRVRRDRRGWSHVSRDEYVTVFSGDLGEDAVSTRRRLQPVLDAVGALNEWHPPGRYAEVTPALLEAVEHGLRRL